MKNYRHGVLNAHFVCIALFVVCAAVSPRGRSGDVQKVAACLDAQPADLPLPSTLPLDAYEKKLYRFLDQRGYRELGWCVDKGVRDTGPYIDGHYY